MPDRKTVKNRLHFDINASKVPPTGDRRAVPLEIRKQRVDAEAKRLCDLGATITVVMAQEGIDGYAVGMKDPEGNEFDLN